MAASRLSAAPSPIPPAAAGSGLALSTAIAAGLLGLVLALH